jgi:hypothetical protein
MKKPPVRNQKVDAFVGIVDGIVLSAFFQMTRIFLIGGKPFANHSSCSFFYLFGERYVWWVGGDSSPPILPSHECEGGLSDNLNGT